MSVQSRPRVRGFGDVGVATVASLAAAVAWGAAFGSGQPLLVVAVGALVYLVAFVLLPAPWRWGALLCSMSLVPVEYLGLPQWLLTLSPWGFLVVVMATLSLARRGGGGLRGRAVLVAGVVWAGWLALCVAASRAPTTSIGWLISFGLLVVLPTTIAAWQPEPVRSLRVVWPVVGAVLSVYAVVETYALGANPLSGLLYSGGGTIEQTWGSYRATTTLGHPLTNGVYFSLAFALALDAFRRGASPWMLPAAALNVMGVLATGSRTALVACGLGFLVIAAGSFRRPAGSRGRYALRAGAMWLLALGAAAAVPFVLAARLGSLEAGRSGAFRVRQIPVALDAVETSPVVGVGPGVASALHESLLRAIGGAGAFESYWLEILVASGVVGLTLAALFYATTLVHCLRSADWGAAALLIVWLVNATTVNALEASRSSHLFLGLVLALAVSGVHREGRHPAPPSLPRGHPDHVMART